MWLRRKVHRGPPSARLAPMSRSPFPFALIVPAGYSFDAYRNLRLVDEREFVRLQQHLRVFFPGVEGYWIRPCETVRGFPSFSLEVNFRFPREVVVLRFGPAVD